MPRKKKKATYAGKVKLREKVLQSGSRSLYLDTWHGGKRHYEFLSLYLEGDKDTDHETLRIAETMRAQRELEIQSETSGIIPAHIRHASFLDYFASIAAKKNNHDSWNATHRYMKKFTHEAMTFGQLTPAWVEQFRDYLKAGKEGAGLSHNTAALYWQKLKCALRTAVRDGKLAIDPSAKVEPIRVRDTEKTHLTLDEVRKLSETPYPRNEECCRAFLFACFCGLRKSDLYALTWDQVQGNSLAFRVTKTGRIENLPLSESAIRFLGERQESGKVFNLPPDRTFSDALMRWGLKAKLNKMLTPHVARHTFAMLALNSDVDIYTLSKLLGHANVKTTTIYAKVLDKRKQEGVDKMPVL